MTRKDVGDYVAGIERLQAKYDAYPRVLSIETHVKCNAICSFCPYPVSTRKGEQMEEALYYKILNDLRDIPMTHRFVANLSRINEPLLDPRLRRYSMDLQFYLPGAHQMFFSNGTTLAPGRFEWIADLPRSELRVSLNSVDPETHKRLMGISLSKVLKNLDNLHKLKAEGVFGAPVSLYGMYDSEDSKREFLDFCAERFPLFAASVRPYFVWQGSVPAGESDKLAAGQDDESNTETDLDLPCGQWFDLNILANGYVTKCCIDEGGFSARDFDVRHNHVLDIYAKSKMLRQDLPARRSISGCETCTHLG